jgi:hypothetical protein
MATKAAFRALDDAGKLPDNYVNPYYLEDLKRRVSVARAGGKLYAFDDLCKHGLPALVGATNGHDTHVPVPRFQVRHHLGRRWGPGRAAAQRQEGGRHTALSILIVRCIN